MPWCQQWWMWERLLKTAGPLKMSNPPQSLLHQIGLAGGTRYVNPNTREGEGETSGCMGSDDIIMFLWLFCLFSPQRVFLASTILCVCFLVALQNIALENWESKGSACLDSHVKHLSRSSDVTQGWAGLADATSSGKATWELLLLPCCCLSPGSCIYLICWGSISFCETKKIAQRGAERCSRGLGSAIMWDPSWGARLSLGKIQVI